MTAKIATSRREKTGKGTIDINFSKGSGLGEGYREDRLAGLLVE